MDTPETEAPLLELPAEDETLQTIQPAEAKGIVDQVNALVRAGEESRAWELIRYLHPADLGMVLVALPRRSREALFRLMSPEAAVWLLRQMNPVQAGRFAYRIGSRTFTNILRQVHPWTAVDALRRLFPGQARRMSETIAELPEAPELTVHSANTAGTLMITDYPTVAIADQAAGALDSLRELQEVSYKFTQVYVVNPDATLAGQASIVDLALSAVDTAVRSLTWPAVITVTPDTPLAECARLRLHYNLSELPVVDADNRLVGVIPAEFLMSATVEQDTQQMLRVNSVGGETPAGPLFDSLRARLPWLTINLGTTFLAAGAISLFEGLLAQVVVLAVFLPVVAGQGGIGGTQTLTLIVRGIALGELAGIAAVRLLAREALLGLLHGLWLGLLVAVIALVWKQNPVLGLVLGIAMLGNMVIAGFMGAAVPLFLRRIGIDPAVASAVIVTTFTDVLGFLLFLGIAAAAINYLR